MCRRQTVPTVVSIGRVYIISLVIFIKMFGRVLCSVLSSLLILFPQITKTTTVYKCGTSKFFVNFKIGVKQFYN